MGDDASAALDKLSLVPAHNKPVAITNFHLPRELRDEIYSHLLHPERVQIDPRAPDSKHRLSKDYFKYHGTAHSYKFYTNILAVNKTIGGEAAEYFRKHCTTAYVVSHIEGLSELLHRWDVPIITGQPLRNPSACPIVITLKWGAEVQKILKKTSNPAWFGVDTFTFVVEDLEKLYQMLRFAFACLTPRRVQMVTGLKPQFPGVKDSISSPYVSVEIRESLCPLSQEKLAVRGLYNLPGAGYSLRPHILQSSRVTEKEKETLKRRTEPALVWPRAQSWNLLEVARIFKYRADELCLSGQLEAAISRYPLLAGSWEAYLPIFIHSRDAGQNDKGYTTAACRWHFLLVDCTLSRFYLALRLGGVAGRRAPLAVWIGSARSTTHFGSAGS